MTAAVAVGLLVAGGVHLLLQRSLVRVILGTVLLGYAVNVLLFAAGGMDRRGLPFAGGDDPGAAADPLPQAFVLTAVVITFSITVYLLAIARAGGQDADLDSTDRRAPSEAGEDGDAGDAGDAGEGAR